jgi:hypothetical protein
VLAVVFLDRLCQLQRDAHPLLLLVSQLQQEAGLQVRKEPSGLTRVVYFLPVSSKGHLPFGSRRNDAKITLSPASSLAGSSKRLGCRFGRNAGGLTRVVYFLPGFSKSGLPFGISRNKDDITLSTAARRTTPARGWPAHSWGPEWVKEEWFGLWRSEQ